MKKALLIALLLTTSQVVAFLQTESATSSGVQIQDPGTGAYIPLLNLSDYSGQGVCQ